MQQQRDIDITLDASINAQRQLVISALDESGQVELDPLDPLGTLLIAHAEVDSLTLRVRDFQQDSALYKVHAATLDQDGKSVRAHWQPMDEDNGQRYTFSRAELDRPGQRIFIGAVPSGRDVPEPLSFAPGARTGVPAPGDGTSDPPGGGSEDPK